jgi:hypothetical protein
MEYLHIYINRYSGRVSDGGTSPMMATRAESSTAATGKAKAAQDVGAGAGYELPWYTPELYLSMLIPIVL